MQVCRRPNLTQRQPSLASPLEALPSLLTSISQLVLDTSEVGLGTANICECFLPCFVRHSSQSLAPTRDNSRNVTTMGPDTF